MKAASNIFADLHREKPIGVACGGLVLPGNPPIDGNRGANVKGLIVLRIKIGHNQEAMDLDFEARVFSLRRGKDNETAVDVQDLTVKILVQ